MILSSIFRWQNEDFQQKSKNSVFKKKMLIFELRNTTENKNAINESSWTQERKQQPVVWTEELNIENS